jgi:hypothetical protein
LKKTDFFNTHSLFTAVDLHPTQYWHEESEELAIHLDRDDRFPRRW